MDHVTGAAMMQDAEWKRNLLDAFDPDVIPEDATKAIRQIAIYRDRWGIDDSPLPLGPDPVSHEWEQLEQRANIGRLIDQATLPSVSQLRAPKWFDDPITQEHRLINVGWQL
jgi:hypothetical protein